MEGILQLKKEVKKLRGQMLNLESMVNSLVNATGATGGLIVWKATLAEILTTAAADFDTIFAENYNAGDGIVTGWYKAQEDSDLIPNGTDIQQLVDGRIIVRFYVREGDGTSIGTSGTSYTVARVIAFPTLADFRGSNITTEIVLVKDANSQFGAFVRDDTSDETGVDGIDWIQNLGSLHYRRLAFA